MTTLTEAQSYKILEILAAYNSTDLILHKLLLDTLAVQCEEAGEFAELQEKLAGLRLTDKDLLDIVNTTIAQEYRVALSAQTLAPYIQKLRSNESNVQGLARLELPPQLGHAGVKLHVSLQRYTPNDAGTFDAALRRIPQIHHPHVLHICGVLLSVSKSCFGIWKHNHAALFAEMAKIDPEVCELKLEVQDAQKKTPTGRLFFRECEALFCRIDIEA